MRFATLLLLAGAAAPGLHAHPEIEAALARINACLAATPQDPALLLERGELYARHDDWISAEANYLKAAELAPGHPGLARARGALALARNDPAEARRLLDFAIARQPDDAASLLLRARAHAALKDRRAAVADLDAMLARITAPSPELFLEKAALLEPGEAIRCLDAAVGRIGPAVSLLLRAAALEESLGRIDDAAARLDRIAGQSERPESWLERRGDLLTRAGRRAEARTAYAAALAAIARLPAWLRESPETASTACRLATLVDSVPQSSHP